LEIKENKMKKILLISIATIAASILVGCGGTSTDNSTKRADWKVETKEDLQKIKESNDKYKGDAKFQKKIKRANWQDEPIK